MFEASFPPQSSPQKFGCGTNLIRLGSLLGDVSLNATADEGEVVCGVVARFAYCVLFSDCRQISKDVLRKRRASSMFLAIFVGGVGGCACRKGIDRTVKEEMDAIAKQHER